MIPPLKSENFNYSVKTTASKNRCRGFYSYRLLYLVNNKYLTCGVALQFKAQTNIHKPCSGKGTVIFCSVRCRWQIIIIEFLRLWIGAVACYRVFFVLVKVSALAAQAAGLSYVQFSRRFKALTGQTPMEYVIELRMKKAQQLLAQTSLSVKEISALCGFSGEYYFSNFFKANFGMSPSAFRNSI